MGYSRGPLHNKGGAPTILQHTEAHIQNLSDLLYLEPSKTPWKVIFHQSHQRVSSIKGRLSLKVVFHRKTSFIQVSLYTQFPSANYIWEPNSCPVRIFESQIRVWYKSLNWRMTILGMVTVQPEQPGWSYICK